MKTTAPFSIFRGANRARPAAFTLIELLASMAVLTLMMVLFLNAIGAVSRTWRQGMARIDNFTKARVILGLLDRDVQSMVLRQDLAAFVDENGKNACAFYTRLYGVGGQRKASLVQYKLTTTADASVLQRSDYALDYINTTLTLQTTNALPDLDPTLNPPKMQVQEMADGILRFEWQFQAGDGSLGSKFVYDYKNRTAMTNSRTLVVSVLVLDDAALRIAKDSGTLASLLQTFQATPADNQSYADYWNTVLANSNFAAGIPKPVSQGVRTYKRNISLFSN